MNKNILLACILAFAFSGCLSLTKELPSFKTYSLDIKKTDSINKFTNKSIYVNEARSISSLNTSSMLYQKDLQQEKFALSKWSDKPSKMLQEIIAKHLVNQNYKFVSTSNSSLQTDYKILAELNSFKQIFKANDSYSKMQIRIFFINNQTKRTYFKNFDYEVKSNSLDAKGGVEAFNTIVNSFVKDLHKFMQTSMKNDITKGNKK